MRFFQAILETRKVNVLWLEAVFFLGILIGVFYNIFAYYPLSQLPLFPLETSPFITFNSLIAVYFLIVTFIIYKMDIYCERVLVNFILFGINYLYFLYIAYLIATLFLVTLLLNTHDSLHVNEKVLWSSLMGTLFIMRLAICIRSLSRVMLSIGVWLLLCVIA